MMWVDDRNDRNSGAGEEVCNDWRDLLEHLRSPERPANSSDDALLLEERGDLDVRESRDPHMPNHGDNSLLKAPPRDGQPGRLAQPSDVIQRLNARLCSERSEQFLTLFYGILDLASYTLCYANAGHPHPVVLSEESEPRELQKNGLPVGIMEGTEYEDTEVQLRPGDRFWLYSDGLLEAMNPADEQFGKDHLLAAMQPRPSEALTDAIRRVLSEVEIWTGNRGQQDDISLVAFEIGRS